MQRRLRHRQENNNKKQSTSSARSRKKQKWKRQVVSLNKQEKTINLCSLSWLQAKNKKQSACESDLTASGENNNLPVLVPQTQKTQQQSTGAACRGCINKKHNKVKQQSSCGAACHGHKKEKTQSSMRWPVTATKEGGNNQNCAASCSCKQQRTINLWGLSHLQEEKSCELGGMLSRENNNLTAGGENNNQPILAAAYMIKTKHQSTSGACNSHSKKQQSKKQQSSFAVACNGQSKEKNTSTSCHGYMSGGRMKLWGLLWLHAHMHTQINLCSLQASKKRTIKPVSQVWVEQGK